MKEPTFIWLFVALFVLLNLIFFFMKSYSLTAHAFANLGLFGFAFLFWRLNQSIESPKSMEESIKAGKLFFKKAMLGDTDTEPPLKVVEVARYKEDVLKTKKDAVHSVVFKNVATDEHVLAKDDPYIRKNPVSIVFFNPSLTFTERPYQTKAEFEREIKYAIPPRYKEPKRKYKVEIKKKEESMPVSA